MHHGQADGAAEGMTVGCCSDIADDHLQHTMNL
jgi:hypothetical protein